MVSFNALTSHFPNTSCVITVVALISLRRSGISALLGLLAALTIGLDGGMLRLPTTLLLVLREGRRSSFRSPSPVLVGLRLGWAAGTDGPPRKRQKSTMEEDCHEGHVG